jgi:hypothetical protein
MLTTVNFFPPSYIVSQVETLISPPKNVPPKIQEEVKPIFEKPFSQPNDILTRKKAQKMEYGDPKEERLPKKWGMKSYNEK